MSATTTEIRVTFHGEGSGVGPLTWGQQEIWQNIERTGRTMNIGGVMALPAGTPLKEIETVLRFVISRHQALRTRWTLEPGTAPQQIVASSGETRLQVVDIEADDDPAVAAEGLRQSYEDIPFDYAHEWPVRMGVVRQAGVLTHVAVQYSHLAVDGQGIQAIQRDLTHMNDAEVAAVQGIRPLELARLQASAKGLRHSEKSLRYWENLLRGIPAQRFSGSTDRRVPRFQELFCYSPAMHLAMEVVAARTRVDTSNVLLAAYAVAMARTTGRHPSVAQVIVSNRFRPGFDLAVAALSQPSLCVVDTEGAGFDEVVGRAWRASTAGNLHGYYDPRQHKELLRRVAAERGDDIDISCFVNDRRNQPPRPGGPLPTREDILAAQARTVLRWDRAQHTYDGRFYLQVDSAPDANVPGRINLREAELPAVYFAIWADTHCLAPRDIEAIARDLEGVVVDAATHESLVHATSTEIAEPVLE